VVCNQEANEPPEFSPHYAGGSLSLFLAAPFIFQFIFGQFIKIYSSNGVSVDVRKGRNGQSRSQGEGAIHPEAMAFFFRERRTATCSPQETHAHKETDTRASPKHVRVALIIASRAQKKRRKQPKCARRQDLYHHLFVHLLVRVASAVRGLV
jgi:hypothetical protein